MATGVFVQQQLTICVSCSERLAIEYRGSHERLASGRTASRLFACPCCGRPTPVVVPLSAGPFVVKAVLGPALPPRAPATGPAAGLAGPPARLGNRPPLTPLARWGPRQKPG